MMQFKTQALGNVSLWLRVFFWPGQERSTKSHESARTKLAPLRVFSWIVLSRQRQSLKLSYPSVGLTTLATLALFALFLSVSCSQSVRHSGMPAGAQTVLDTAIEDIDAGRYEKLYHEAADEWRNDSTLDESKATFQKLHDKLGKVRTRDLQSVREEQTGSAPIVGHSVIAIYQTSFEQGSGMETFTLLERHGGWYLGRYYVTSNALK
jgi:hypothetical protein